MHLLTDKRSNFLTLANPWLDLILDEFLVIRDDRGLFFLLDDGF